METDKASPRAGRVSLRRKFCEIRPHGSSVYGIGATLAGCSRPLGLGRFPQSDSLHLLQKIAAVYDVGELERSLTATPVREKLFYGVVWVGGLDGDRPQISGLAKPDNEL